MPGFQTTAQLYESYDTTIGYQAISDPGSNGTFALLGRWGQYAVIASGTRKLPNNIPPFVKFYVYATGNVTLTSAAGVTVATLADGEVAECMPTSATTWVATVVTAARTLTAVYTHLLSTQGFIALPLAGWREVFSNDIGVAAVAAAQGSGGILATDTTPALEYTNGDTNSTLRLLWAASNSDPLVQQVALPPDLDLDQPIVFRAIGRMSGANDSPVLDLDSYFYSAIGAGGTKVEDATSQFVDSVTEVTATIAAADVAGVTMTLEITPGAHANDTLAVYSTWLTYNKKLLTS